MYGVSVYKCIKCAVCFSSIEEKYYFIFRIFHVGCRWDLIYNFLEFVF